jgi:hypothetical protein
MLVETDVLVFFWVGFQVDLIPEFGVSECSQIDPIIISQSVHVHSTRKKRSIDSQLNLQLLHPVHTFVSFLF